ncbi:acetyl esterase/lipase [Arthrobacter sp. CAN_A212]|uniref:alpha/beta hydrolase family protein n=1 Tax=unclassified Arthrobacter TaxID=235627 RepID=UPI001A2C2878|nr:acetyl esterase/lipase [Arthrobacter sp. CAN_C5]
MDNLRRRTILGAAGLAAAAALAGCAAAQPGTPQKQPEEPVTPQRYTYGDDPSQFAELYLPAGERLPGVVVIIHGGYWRSGYGLDLGQPLAEDLVSRGYVCWNLEYRRVGDGGGWPETFADVGAGIDLLATAAGDHGLDLTVTTALGHSAGGHLAVWAAGRSTLPDGAPGAGTPVVPLTGVVSQSGVLNLVEAHELGLSDGAVLNLMGVDQVGDPERYRAADPMTAIPLAVPVLALHGEEDSTVPASQSESYVAAALAAGADAELTLIPGDHFAMITPGTDAWVQVVAAVDRLMAA